MAIHVSKLVRSSSALALLTQCVVAGASILTTPETESFTLKPAQVEFTVVNDDGTVTNTNNSPKTDSATLTFNQFDTSLGTLLGVTISFDSTYSLGPSLSVTFATSGSSDPESIAYSADGTLDLSLSGTGLILTQSLSPSASATCTTDYVACQGNPAATTDSFIGTTPGKAPLSAFEGLGTYNLTASLSSALAPSISPDNVTTGGFADNATMDGTLDSNWSGTVSVVYEYEEPQTTVPEPMTLYLLVAGVGGLAVLRRRRG